MIPGLFLNKYVIMAIAIGLLILGMKMALAKYNDAIAAVATLESSLATATQVNEKNAAKILELEANRKQMEAALVNLAKTTKELEVKKDEAIGKWKGEVSRLRSEGDKCVDAPLPPSFFDGLRPRNETSGSRDGHPVRLPERAFVGTRSPSVLWQKLERYKTLYLELANSH